MHKPPEVIIKRCGICEHEIQIKIPVYPYKTVICKNCNAHYLPNEKHVFDRSRFIALLARGCGISFIFLTVYGLFHTWPALFQNFWIRVLSGMVVAIIPFVLEQLFLPDRVREYEFKLIETPAQVSKSWGKKENLAIIGSFTFAAGLLGVLFLFIT